MFVLICSLIVSAIAFAVAVVTLLPKLPSHRWWVRAWDFPRAQIAILAALTIPGALVMPGLAGWAALAVLSVCLVYHCWRILPYTPLTKVEMEKVARTGDGSQVTILAANIQMANDRFEDVRRLVADVDPDILFLMETDARWHDALREVLDRYPQVVTEIRDNCYGFIFATRLETPKAKVVYLTPDDTPSLFCELLSPHGQRFRFVGLHPRPPVPGNTTEERDAEILFAARFAHKTDMPLIAMGDFNDAAWSDTSRRFKTVGGYLDPRVGRGMVASFHAKSRILRAPIDQFYATPDIALCDFARGPDIGSDHFPIIARIDLDGKKARASNTEPKDIEPEERDRRDAIFDRYADGLENRPEFD